MSYESDKKIEPLLWLYYASWPWAIMAIVLGCFVAQNLVTPGFVHRHEDHLKELLLVAVNAGAIGAGFLMSAKPILLTAGKSHAVQILRKSQAWPEFVRILNRCMIWYGTLIIASGILVLVIDITTWQAYPTPFLLAFWFGLVVGTMRITLRVFNLYQDVVNFEAEEVSAELG